jgi:transketolase
MMRMEHVLRKLGIPTSSDPGRQRAIANALMKNARIVLVLSDSSGYIGDPAVDWCLKNAPERVIELGIAEGNAATFAAGLASEDYVPIWGSPSFAGIGRAYNQIRQCVCVDRFNVKFVFGRCGYGGSMGVSHNYIEDFAAMRVLPNMVIVNPADIVEAEKMMDVILEYIGPVYYRVETGTVPFRIYEDTYRFNIGKATTLREGKDAAIVATGCMVTESLLTSELLSAEGIDVQIINMSTIKPIDEATVLAAAKKTGAIVTAENHMITGGLGDAVSTVLAENEPTPMERIGLRDQFSQSGIVTPEGVDELKVYLKLTATDIAVAVKKVMARKR